MSRSKVCLCADAHVRKRAASFLAILPRLPLQNPRLFPTILPLLRTTPLVPRVNACPAPSPSPHSIPPSPPYSPPSYFANRPPPPLLPLIQQTTSTLLPIRPPLSLSSSLVPICTTFHLHPQNSFHPRPYPSPSPTTSQNLSLAAKRLFFVLGKRGNAEVKKWEVGEGMRGGGMRFGKRWRSWMAGWGGGFVRAHDPTLQRTIIRLTPRGRHTPTQTPPCTATPSQSDGFFPRQILERGRFAGTNG